MRATIWALLVVSRRVGHALQPGRGPVFCRTGDNGGTHGRLSASQTRHFVPKQSSHQHLTFWTTLLLLPKRRRRPPQQPEATTGVSPFQLWAAGSEDVEPFPGLSSFNLEEEEGDEDGYYVLDDEGDYGGGGNDGEGEEGLEHEDRFGLLSADPNPPPLEEAWALAAAELSAEVPGPNGESAGAVDLDLLGVPPWSNPLLNDDDDGEELDLDSLDVADFLAPEVEVGAVDPGVPGYGNVGAGGGPPGLRSASVVAKKRPRQGGMGGYVGEDGGDSGSGADDASNGGGSGKDWGGVGKPTKAPAEKPKSKGVSGQGVKARRGGGGGEGAGVGAGGLDGLTADEVERKLISAGILRADGAEIDLEEEGEGGEGEGWGGVYNEIEVSDGEEACRILEERLDFDQEGIAYLRAKYPPLRGELWYRREPAPAGAKTGKKFLDVYFLEETLPELLDLLLGDEEEAAHEGGGGIGLTVEQVREMFTMTPSLLGIEASDANDVATYLRSELGLRGQGRLAGALAGCPPMLMYHTWDNLRKKVSYYREALAWTNYDVAAMLAVYPNFLSIKMENDVIEVIDYLRTEIGLQPFMVSTMVRDFPEVLEVRPKRLKAVVKYLWKVLEIPRSGIAVLLSQHPRACSLEAEANLAPLRQFFERELFVEDTARIGHLVYKFPRLLFQDVETQLVPRAEEFRKAMGLEGLEPLPPRIRDRPKRNKRKEEYAAGGRGGRGQSGVGRGAGGGSGRPRSSNGSGGVGRARGRGARSGAGRPRAANSGFGGRGREAPGGRGGRAGRTSSGGRGRGEYRGRGSGGYVE